MYKIVFNLRIDLTYMYKFDVNLASIVFEFSNIQDVEIFLNGLKKLTDFYELHIFVKDELVLLLRQSIDNIDFYVVCYPNGSFMDYVEIHELANYVINDLKKY